MSTKPEGESIALYPIGSSPKCPTFSPTVPSLKSHSVYTHSHKQVLGKDVRKSEALERQDSQMFAVHATLLQCHLCNADWDLYCMSYPFLTFPVCLSALNLSKDSKTVLPSTEKKNGETL